MGSRRGVPASEPGCGKTHRKLALQTQQIDKAQNVEEVNENTVSSLWKDVIAELQSCRVLFFLIGQNIVFLIFIVMPSLTHGLFRSILLHLQTFGYFPILFFLLILHLIPLWSEHILGVVWLCSFSIHINGPAYHLNL